MNWSVGRIPSSVHSPTTASGHDRIPVHPHAGQGRTGPHDGRPNAGPFQLHLQGADVALSPHLDVT